MRGDMKVTVKMKDLNRLLRDKGLSADGSVQAFHTQNVMRRIIKYMPYRSGATIKKTILDTDINQPYIVTNVPHGKLLYYGKLMVDPITGAAGFKDKDGQWKSWKGRPKVKSDRPINYTTTKNPQAGPFWDRALVAAEMPALQADLQRYIDRRSGK